MSAPWSNASALGGGAVVVVVGGDVVVVGGGAVVVVVVVPVVPVVDVVVAPEPPRSVNVIGAYDVGLTGCFAVPLAPLVVLVVEPDLAPPVAGAVVPLEVPDFDPVVPFDPVEECSEPRLPVAAVAGREASWRVDEPGPALFGDG